MKPETQAAVILHLVQPDFREVLTAVFGPIGPEAGHIEWLLDRIEGRPEPRTWA